MRLNSARKKFYQEGLKELPPDFVKDFKNMEGANGETLKYDEAEVWKRVLNYRIIKETNPKCILETHAGKSLSTKLYEKYSNAEIISLENYQTELSCVEDDSCDIIDIDPFGQPYDCLKMSLRKLKDNGIIMMSNGEMLSVTRNLRKTQHLKTENYGKLSPKWVMNEYLPYIEKISGLEVQFFYAFPTTIRTVLSNQGIDESCFMGCKKWMWWLEKYS